MSEPRSPRALVVGTGLAGLTCALDLAAGGWEVDAVSAGRAGRDGATHRVDALAPWILLTAPWVKGDSPDRFLAELKARGQGLERDGLAEIFAAGAHAAARGLMEVLDLEPLDGAPVALPGEDVPRGLRCRPRQRRVMLAPLLARCAAAGVRIRERTVVYGLLLAEGRAAGALAWLRDGAGPVRLAADIVVLACGGTGAVFPVTTSPRWCRGTGIALAGGAGALLHRPEMTQALPVTATPPLYFPTSAALAAGTIWINGRALAPERDLESTTREVAAAVQRDLRPFLDPSGNGSALLPARVLASPTFRAEGRVPLTVAQHHSIGGVAIDGWGRTSLPGLYACGEAAGGVQGRRRTMGTGLVEAALFGKRAAAAAVRDRGRLGHAGPATELAAPDVPDDPAGVERRLNEVLGPLVVLRPAGLLGTAIGALRAFPVHPAGDAATTEKGALAGIRRQAALTMLVAEAAGGRLDEAGDAAGAGGEARWSR